MKEGFSADCSEAGRGILHTYGEKGGRSYVSV